MHQKWIWIIALLVGLMLGGVGGFIAASQNNAPSPAPKTLTQPSSTPNSNPPQTAPHDAGSPQTPTTTTATSPKLQNGEACATLEKQATSLRSEVAALRRQLAFEKTFREQIEGTPITFPTETAARFQEDALVAQIKKSIDATGIDAVIENVDCDEFPCIVYGAISSDISSDVAFADLKLLHQETHKDNYKGDSFYISHTTQEPTEEGQGDPMVIFNISYYPSDLQEDASTAVGKRLKYRKDRYFDALR